MSGKQIWIIEDDGNRLVRFREVQQCWKSTNGQHVPDTFNMYRYIYAEKWQRATCTSTPSTCTGTSMQKSGKEKHVPVHPQHVPVHLCKKVPVANMYRYTTNLYRYTCVKTVGIEQEFDPNARACFSINF